MHRRLSETLGVEMSFRCPTWLVKEIITKRSFMFAFPGLSSSSSSWSWPLFLALHTSDLSGFAFNMWPSASKVLMEARHLSIASQMPTAADLMQCQATLWICHLIHCMYTSMYYMGVSKNRGTPKSSILIGFSIIIHPFWVALFVETPI